MTLVQPDLALLPSPADTRDSPGVPVDWARQIRIFTAVADLAILASAVGLASLLASGPLGPVSTFRDLVIPCWAVTLLVLGGYGSGLVDMGGQRVGPALRAGITVLLATLCWAYFSGVQTGRTFVALMVSVALPGTLLSRFVGRRRLARSRAKGRCRYRTLLVGSAATMAGPASWLPTDRQDALDVVGVCLIDGPSASAVGGHCVLGPIQDLPAIVALNDIEVVAVGPQSGLDGESLRQLGWEMENVHAEFMVVSPIVGADTRRVGVRSIDHRTVLHLSHPRFDAIPLAAWTVVQRLMAVLLVAAIGPLLLGIAVAIRLDSPGGALFRQVRVGRHGEQFTMLKFRTMVADAEQRLAELERKHHSGAGMFKLRADPRMTRIGKYLRRTSLDELPQLFNVVAGHMTLVGPRPALPKEVAAYDDRMRRRLLVRPGITGMWQVSGRSDLAWEDAVRLDLGYVENRSIFLDLDILFRTFRAVLKSSGAY